MRTKFDLEQAMKEAERGKEQAAKRRKECLKIARAAAVFLATGNLGRQTHIDEVQDYLSNNFGIYPDMLGNAAGSVFKSYEWKPVGYERSQRVSNHGRMIRVWRLR